MVSAEMEIWIWISIWRNMMRQIGAIYCRIYLFQHGDDLIFFEAQVASLRGLEGEDRPHELYHGVGCVLR